MATLAYHSTIKLRPTTPFSHKNPTHFISTQTTLFRPSSYARIEPQKVLFRISSALAPKARFVARRKETVQVQQLQRPLLEYMSLPASQYSVLDAERIERVDDNTFRCYVYRFKFFAFEVCPVLLVRVEEQPNGCCIKLLSCKLEGSPLVVAQNDKFDVILLCSFRSALTLVWYGNAAYMVNRISCDTQQSNSTVQLLTSDTVIEVSIEVPFPFRAIPVEAIESTGTRVLEQILAIMLPRFMAQVCDASAEFLLIILCYSF
ncbi:hypothetical protein Cgig2_012888 [Carnegiea gigantea]|uniref:Uncharacterized protein n=1 Tax=Carnegiea gigantea TaxID=171969 RepID=A0A9Q1Q9Y9_9CARY|nr:hypothetical protein Cgig2_012888 [Carnegiea gigantea]